MIRTDQSSLLQRLAKSETGTWLAVAAVIYVATDPFLDLLLVLLATPWSEALYASRYGGLFLAWIVKAIWKRDNQGGERLRD